VWGTRRWYTGRVTGLSEIAPGVLVGTSSFELTTTTVVAGSEGGCLLIDPAVTVAELARLVADLRELGLRPVAGWSTHPHWDHVLWSRDLGRALRYATPAAAAFARAELAELAREAQQSAPGHDVSLLGRLTALDANVIPWDGPEARLIVHDGHAPGHGAVFLPGTGVLVGGDMCSDVEIPLLDLAAPDPLGDYRVGLERLAAVTGVRHVVPGHGHVGDGGEFRRRLAADAAYLDALAEGEPFEDPRVTGGWMHEAHDDHLRYVRRRARPRPGTAGAP
jgi:glyoxylase-like metal-dependent hydrolase (beta-lactamase superfamily II)